MEYDNYVLDKTSINRIMLDSDQLAITKRNDKIAFVYSKSGVDQIIEGEEVFAPCLKSSLDINAVTHKLIEVAKSHKDSDQIDVYQFIRGKEIGVIVLI